MDTWAEGDGYQRYMGRWSDTMADVFLAWLGEEGSSRWLDVGCGTGALSAAVMRSREPDEMAGIDASAGFIAAARARLGERPDLRVADARSLPFPDRHFDATVSGLCLNFVPEPAAGVAEMTRVTRPGGTVAAYVWDYAEGMQMIRRFWDAAIARDPASEALDEARRFPVCHPEPLAALFTDSGLHGVQVAGLEIRTTFSDFDDYWQPFLGGQGPGPSYVMSLDEDQRQHLARTLQADLPLSADGSIELTARAWAVKGAVPGSPLAEADVHDAPQVRAGWPGPHSLVDAPRARPHN